MYSSLGFGNGVAISVDKKELYVVSSTTKEMVVLDPTKPDIPILKKVRIPTIGDNFYVTSNKEGKQMLFLGAHPNIVHLLQYMYGYRDHPV